LYGSADGDVDCLQPPNRQFNNDAITATIKQELIDRVRVIPCVRMDHGRECLSVNAQAGNPTIGIAIQILKRLVLYNPARIRWRETDYFSFQPSQSLQPVHFAL
jgi:hypothetical protein